jgi:hypothetical protein
VANLRWAPCAGTVGALAQCTGAFAAGTACTGGGCTAFTSAPSCSQVVFQVGDAGACKGALPIAPDASCPP